MLHCSKICQAGEGQSQDNRSIPPIRAASERTERGHNVDKPPFDIWSKTAAQFQETVSQSWTKALENFKTLDVGAAMSTLTHAPAPPTMQFSPDKLQAVQQQYMQDAQALMTQMMSEGGVQTQDKRFANPAWHHNPVAALSAAVYLLNSRTLMALTDAVDADEKTRNRLRFAVEQGVAAAAPSNFLAFNAEAQEKALETKGESIAKGIQNLLHDMRQGHVSMTDESVFTVGKNVATTEGAV
ncbi:MAG: hypothetical protein EBT37_06565, partial [Betaproteobacteria bacterium]|nr:hypothetical protein [Betaproteobacteria bacterium]